MYVCDKCGRDVTEHLYRARAHVWRPLGPAKYVCACGAEYVSGADEWENLSPWERRNRVGQTLGLGAVLALILLTISALLRETLVHGGIVLTILAILAAAPAVVSLAFFAATALDAIEIAISIYRTRLSRIWRIR